MRPSAGEAGSAAPSVAPDAGAAAAAEAEAGSLRDELAGVREQAAETEAAFAAQLARAQEAERVALQAKAAAEARATVLEARVQSQADVLASGGQEAAAAHETSATLSSQLLELQRALRERGEALAAAQADARREAGRAELEREQVSLLRAAEQRQRHEMQEQARSAAQLRELLSHLQEMQKSQVHAEEVTSGRLQGENERLQREWLEAKAATSREEERSAKAAAEAPQQLTVDSRMVEQRPHRPSFGAQASRKLAAAAEEREVVEGQLSAARDEAAALRTQVETLHTLHEAQKLQLSEAGAGGDAPGGASAAGGVGSPPPPSRAGSRAAGSAGLAEEVAVARRERKRAEEGLAAEKAHSAQYRALAAAAEKERDEQLQLSSQLKESLEARVAEAEAARSAAEERVAGIQQTEGSRRAEAESLRSQLSAAKQAEAAAEAKAAEIVGSADAVASEHAAALEALRVQLEAARGAEERAVAKYRAELQNHSADTLELAKAKEAATSATADAQAAAARLGEQTTQLETLRQARDAARAEVETRVGELEQRLASAADENRLLHGQLSRLSAQATAAATAAASPAGRREAGGSSSTGGAAGGEDSATALLAVVQRDKELLAKKVALAELEVRRLTGHAEARSPRYPRSPPVPQHS